MKELTRAEEQVMQILWKLGKGFVKDLLEEFPEPRPAYNTVSTIVRILERKGFVDQRSFGKTYEYYPVVPKDAYMKSSLHRLVSSYFNDSYQEMVSFFTKERNLKVNELEEILKVIREQIEKQKRGSR